ncbi:tRNA (adenine(22)-N(1))-methyltransferase [Aliamphritea spongicola]|uniref:tRNA (adenine(22)-N(1))-methyltransferase n=1 Tax=Aliamphritea spongicola TaxID=707589 RepID=UPI00196B55A4|nr:tRNA (adenine(22)-N(1))-methyltransferase TrmK [Aliamphritea spongicola]MBN3563725.1 tRNA (adenine(22)-N(1))-methyltransferase TrmK [Aliamphritea spongicola]
MKVSRRLHQLSEMVRDHYSHIWDCCCDHGLLGQLLLDRGQADCVHFVDVVPALMTQLEAHLQQTYSGKRWQVHCLDVARLPLSNYTQAGKPQLVIIAGVGGDLLMDLVTAICQSQPNVSVEFLLCPVYHTYKVRRALADLSLGLISETLVEDKQRFYEILHVSAAACEPVTPVGEQMWNFSDSVHLTYLQQTLNHYRRMACNPQQDVSAELEAYRRLLPDV